MMRSRRGERGAAAVEMAIVLPLLILLLGGIVDFGRAFMREVILTNAAREGARVAQLTADPAQIPNITTRAKAAADIDPTATITVTVTNDVGDATACTGTATQVTVLVSAPFDWTFLKPLSLPSSLSGKSVLGC